MSNEKTIHIASQSLGRLDLFGDKALKATPVDTGLRVRRGVAKYDLWTRKESLYDS